MTIWHHDSITQGELDALCKTAERAWGDDTRYPLKRGDRRPEQGQSYVTARWLTERLGGHVGVNGGRYAWVSPDSQYAIDLTCKFYGQNDGYEPCPNAKETERTSRFSKRANIIFGSLDSLLKTSLDYSGDAYPAEEPQRASDIDQQYWDDEPDYEPTSGEYKFVYANGQLEVSPSHDHKQLSEHAGIDPQHQGPMAVGWVIINNGKATWEVQSNVNIRSLQRVFKDYCKNIGWTWGGITNIEGEPINDEFAPRGSSHIRYAFNDGHLYLGRVSHSELAIKAATENPLRDNACYGWITVGGDKAQVWPVHVAAIPSLCEWAEDQSLTLYAGNDNVIKTIEDLEVENTGANSGEMETAEEPPKRNPSGLYQCPTCDRLFPRWQLYDRHRKDGCADVKREINENGGFPEIGTDEPDPFKPHVTPLQPEIFPLASLREAARVDGFLGGSESDTYFVAYHYGCPVGYARLHLGKVVDLHYVKEEAKRPLLAKVMKYTDKQPKDLISGAVPFIYDVQDDEITVGQQGQRLADIPGKFTPGGIVEGTYEPGGKVVIRSMTNMPYTVRHMVELWYYQHPELEVKNVHLRDDKGSDTKLAASNQLGSTVAMLALANPVVDEVAKALHNGGGEVYAVGGAVRDVMLGKQPKDIDLMVTGLPGEEVESLLTALDGKVDYTGQDFGVFRFKKDGDEVEVSLPRKERSTGAGHTDFDVQTDHRMTPHEDLFRRDFTANAMAVNLNSGRLIDPHNGAKDITNGTLRTLHSDSLKDDPLRVVRALVAKGRHGLDPDEATRLQMQYAASGLDGLPPERIQLELDKLMASDQPAEAIRLAYDTGVLAHIFPEVYDNFNYDQKNRHHDLTLGEHTLSVLRSTAERTDDPDVRLAALLHDIGKPSSAWKDPITNDHHYYRKDHADGSSTGKMHEAEGAHMAREALERLRYPSDRVNRVGQLVRHHMFAPFTNERGARRFLNKVEDHADDLLHIRWSDSNGKSVPVPGADAEYETQAKLIEQVRNEQQPTNRSQLAVNGQDLLDLGIPKGPQIGQILNELTQATIDDPELNERATLLELARPLDSAA